MNTIRRSMLANFVGQGWTALSGFIFVPLYIQFLGIEAYGVIGFFAVLQASLSLFDLGMTPTISRQLARFTGGSIAAGEAVQLVRVYVLISLAIGFGITAGLSLSASYFANEWFRDARLDPSQLYTAFLCISAVVGLRFCEGLLRGALVGLDRQIMLNGLLVLFATLRNGGVVIALLFIGPTLPVFFGYQAVLSVLVLLSFGVAVRSALPDAKAGRLSFAPVRASMGFSGGMLVIAGSSLVITQADKFVLSRLVPLAEFSAYMVAVLLASALPLIVGPVAQAVYPLLVRYVSTDDQQMLAPLYHKASELAAALVLPVVMLAIFFPEAIIMVWSGNQELAESLTWILPLVVAGTGANALFWLPYHAQLAMGWTGMMAKFNVAAAVMIIALLTITVPRYGVMAGAVIWLALNLTYLFILVPVVHRRFLPGQSGAWLRNVVLLPILAVSAVCGLAHGLRPAMDERIEQIVFLGLTYALSVCAAALTPKMLRKEILDGVRRRLRRRGLVGLRRIS